jgi:hypothetical protein
MVVKTSHENPVLVNDAGMLTSIYMYVVTSPNGKSDDWSGGGLAGPLRGARVVGAMSSGHP